MLMKMIRNLVLVLCVWAFVPLAGAELTVYYLRHAEAGHNIGREWQTVPKDQWPSYLGNPNIFTPAGLKQVEEVSGKLARHQFDLIAVSPLWRTRNTVLPYLRAHELKAELWPELIETGGIDLKANIATQTVSAALFESGRAAKLPEEERPFFVMRPGESTARELKVTNLREGVLLAEKTRDLLRDRFRGRDATVLLVGHAVSGQTLIKVLTGNMEFGRGLLNARLWAAREQPTGTFELTLFNDQPVTNGVIPRI
jgi:broad specificity phosphatase PhoE